MARGLRVRHYRREGYRLVHVFIRPDVYEAVVELSVKRGVNVSDIINEALEEYLKHDSRPAA